jgi:translation initiation factor IF-1
LLHNNNYKFNNNKYKILNKINNKMKIKMKMSL